MGCCSPEYRKVVNEEEERVNQKGKDAIPFLTKLIIIVISTGGLALSLFM